MNNRPSLGFMGVLPAAAWNNATSKDGMGFILIDSNAIACCAGLCPINLANKLEMDMKAPCWALLHSITCMNLFCLLIN